MALRDALLRHMQAAPDEVRAKIEEDLGSQTLENLFAAGHVMLAPTVRASGDTEMAALCVEEELAKLKTRRGVSREVDEAAQDISGVVDEGLTWRLSQAAEARNRAERCEAKDEVVYDYGDNGAAMDREERERLDGLLNRITFTKNRRG